MTGWQAQAFAAYRAGDREAARRTLLDAGPALMTDSGALQLLGLVSGEAADARALFEHAALAVDPGDAQALFNLGVADQDAGALDLAQLRYEQALRLAPHHLGALNNLSDLLRRQGRADEAWDCLQRYLRAGGDPAGLEIRLAKVADDHGLADEARHWFARAEAREPDSALIGWERALQQLRDEEFEEGWTRYELRRARFAHDTLAIVDYRSMPAWTGDPLAGRSLLVHKEQGLGDTVMFASCLPDLPGDVGTLHLAVAPALVRLFAASFPRAHVWASVSTPQTDQEHHQPWRALAGPIDAHIPFGSLPLHLRRHGFPAPRVTLRPRPEDAAAWSVRLDLLAPRSAGTLRAGLVTIARRGGPTGSQSADGPPRSLSPLAAGGLAVPGVQWIGLHDRVNAPEFARIPGLSVIACSDWIHDMADTAALIAGLDLVVTVDTAVAHVAAAMGRKVLLMLRRLGDWRWGRSRHDSYWYPDVEIFRQEREGHWEPVVRRVADRLAALAAQRGTAPDAQG